MLMQENTSLDNRIETLAKTGSLDSTFQRFGELARRFGELQVSMYAQQARFASVQDSDRQGILGDESKNLELNRIRQGFLAELEEYKRDLHNYLDLTQPELLLRGVSDQMQIVEEVMSQRLRGFYQIERSMGEGNSALIFQLRDIFTGRLVVAKVLKVPVLTQEIKDEIRQTSLLKHRNIIKLMGESLERFPFYILCEYVNGGVLNEMLDKTGPRPPSQAIDWLFSLADALSYLRQKRLLHSNVRPSKIYIDEENQLMISPFDIIKAGMDDRSLRKFREDCQYLSPEFLDGDGEHLSFPAMRLSDQFSIGLVAYKMLTAKDLFEGDSVLEIMRNRARFFEEKKFRREKMRAIPHADLAAIIDRMLQLNPGERYPDLHEVLNRIRQLSMKPADAGAVVRNSYRRCLISSNSFIHEFYQAFFLEISPEHRTQFTNQERQNTMLQLAIDVLIDVDEKQEILRNIIRSGKHMQFSLNEYGRFFDVLIRLVQQHDAKAWCADLERDWLLIKTKALTVIQAVLAEGKEVA